MNLTAVKRVTQTAGRVVKTNLPSILTGVGVAGMVAAVVDSAKSSTRAQQILAEMEEEKGAPLTAMEKVRCYAKAFWKTILLLLVSAGLILGADVMHIKRLGMAAGAYSLMAENLREENSQLKELLGGKREKESKEEIARNTVTNLIQSGIPVIETGQGNTIFVDGWSKRIFKHDFEKIRRIKNDLNDDIYKSRGRAWTNMGAITLNDIYSSLNLDTIPAGNCVVWNGETGPIDFEITSVKLEDGLNYNMIDWGIGRDNISTEYM